MDNFLSLKNWLTLSQAAEYISSLTNNSRISTTDILQLVIENNIRTSVVFPRGPHAYACELIDTSQFVAKSCQLPLDLAELSVNLGTEDFLVPNGPYIVQMTELVLLDDHAPYDLLMMGNGRSIAHRQFRQESGQYLPISIDDGPIFVSQRADDKEKYFVLATEFIASDGSSADFETVNLPPMATYVIRQSEIQRFVMILAGDKISTLSEPEKIRMDVPRWPWGNHHTELLGQLNAAASRWWVNRDPDDNTTAPTNEEVSAWLQQRGVSKRSADALATILRADGLPTGPRT